MMTRQLLLNTNFLIDCSETLDLEFLRLTLHRNDKDFILITPSDRQVRDFSKDLSFFSLCRRYKKERPHKIENLRIRYEYPIPSYFTTRRPCDKFQDIKCQRQWKFNYRLSIVFSLLVGNSIVTL